MIVLIRNYLQGKKPSPCPLFIYPRCTHTKIPHDELLAVLYELVEFCFSGGIKKFVKVHSCKAFWTDVHHERQITSKDSIKQAYEDKFMESMKFSNITSTLT